MQLFPVLSPQEDPSPLRVTSGTPFPASGRRSTSEPLESPLFLLSTAVLTYHNNAEGTGVNASETQLEAPPTSARRIVREGLHHLGQDGQISLPQPLVVAGRYHRDRPQHHPQAAGVHDIVLVRHRERLALRHRQQPPRATGAVLLVPQLHHALLNRVHARHQHQ